MRTVAALLLTLIASPVFAQQANPPQSPMEQALTSKLTEEYNQNLQLRASIIQAHEQITAQQKQIDDLKAKYEPPKKEEPRKAAPPPSGTEK